MEDNIPVVIANVLGFGTKYGCKICIAKSNSSFPEGYFDTPEEIANHLEMEHGCVVLREEETSEDAQKRCDARKERIKKGDESNGQNL